MTLTRAAVAALLIIGVAPAAAFAQSQRFTGGGSIGVARTWDDESLLGSGPATEARFGVRITPKTQVEFAVTRIPYDRRFESGVATSGRSVFTGLLIKHDFTHGTVRPFVTAGYGLNDHRGSRTDPHAGRREVSSTDHGYFVGTGAVVHRGRWQAGPEGRVYMLAVERDSSAAMILSLGLRAAVSF